jgi:hypothetical protein
MRPVVHHPLVLVFTPNPWAQDEGIREKQGPALRSGPSIGGRRCATAQRVPHISQRSLWGDMGDADVVGIPWRSQPPLSPKLLETAFIVAAQEGDLFASEVVSYADRGRSARLPASV